jgi:hypothetical protein
MADQTERQELVARARELGLDCIQYLDERRLREHIARVAAGEPQYERVVARVVVVALRVEQAQLF